jgi:predicted RNA-binding protein
MWLLYTMPEVNKIIDILQSERSFGGVIREIQVNFRCIEIAHWYNTWLGSY